MQSGLRNVLQLTNSIINYISVHCSEIALALNVFSFIFSAVRSHISYAFAQNNHFRNCLVN